MGNKEKGFAFFRQEIKKTKGEVQFLSLFFYKKGGENERDKNEKIWSEINI
jgi:hypothetical protein